MILLTLLGCLPEDQDAALRVEILGSLAEGFVTAEYQDFATRSQEMADAAAAFCAAPSEQTLQDAQSAWWDTSTPWKRAEVVKFGPTIEYPTRYLPKLDDWPVNADSVEELVAGDTELDFSTMGSANRGLPVVEYLLYSPDSLSALSENERRCAVLAGAAQDVADNASGLHDAWAAEWQAWVTDPSANPNDYYELPQNVVDEWVNRMAFTVENIRETKLGNPIGDKTGGELNLDGLENRSSARSLQTAKDALAGAQLVWTGPEGGQGMRDLGHSVPDLQSELDGLFADAQAALEAIPEPLETAIQEQPETVVAAQEALQALQVGLQVDLAPVYNVSIAFNDNDGD